MRVDILDERECDHKKWHSNKESDESEKVLRYEEYDECDKYWNTHIGGYYLRIEIICLDRMDDCDHGDDECYGGTTTIPVGDDEDRDSRDECPKNRNKSKHKNNEWECEDKWEYRTPMEEWYDDESNRGENSIDYGNQWLSPEDRSESIPDFASNDSIFPIEKCEIPSLHLREKSSNRLTLYDEYIGEDQSDEELGQYDSRIAEVSKDGLSDGLEIVLIDNISDYLIESERDRELRL